MYRITQYFVVLSVYNENNKMSIGEFEPMGLIFILGILIFRVFQKISTKAISKRIPSDMAGLASFNAISMGMSALFAGLLLLATFSFGEFAALPTLGWLIACATGLAICTSSVCSLLAMRGSSILLDSLFSMAGLLVPTVSGIFILSQSVVPMQWMGMVLLFGSAFLLASSSKKTNGKITVKTMLLLFGSMLANGCTMLLQVLFKTYVPTGSVLVYSFLQFAIVSLFLFAVAFILSRKEKKKWYVPDKKLLAFTAISAGALFGISQLSTMASEIIPVAVLFPVSDGGGMIISALVADLIYKEKINAKSFLGIIIGIAGLIFMKLFAQ